MLKSSNFQHPGNINSTATATGVEQRLMEMMLITTDSSQLKQFSNIKEQ